MADLRVAERVKKIRKNVSLKRAATKKNIGHKFLPNLKFGNVKKKHRLASGLSQSRACPTNVRHLQEMFSNLLADEIVHLARFCPLADFI